MSFFRLLRQSIIFATRSRRLLIFVFIFAVLTGVTVFSLDSISQENTTALLTTKAVIIQNTNFNSSITYTNATNLVSKININQGLANVVYLRYVQVGPAYIFSLSPNPWENPEIRPSDIRTGSYVNQWGLSSDGSIQAIASAGSQTPLSIGNVNSGNYSVNQDITVGNRLYIERNNNQQSIRYIQVVGMFNKTTTFSDPISDRLWLFVSDNEFTPLVNEIFGSPTVSPARVYQIVFVAKGSTEQIQGFFSGDATANLAKLLTNAQNNLPAGWALGNSININTVKTDATNQDLFLIFGVAGSTIVATLYAFIISRFRTREIATLKAVGYTASQVRVVLLAEIATVSIVGFVISVFSIQILLTLNSFYTLNSTYIPNIWVFWNILSPLNFGWLPSFTVILAFIAVVLSNIIGFLIISRKTISVRPIELFRADA